MAGEGEMKVRNVDPTLKRQFKAVCTLQGKDMSEKLHELMEQEVKSTEIQRVSV